MAARKRFPSPPPAEVRAQQTYRYIILSYNNSYLKINLKRRGEKKSGNLVGIDLSVAANVFPVKVTVGQIEIFRFHALTHGHHRHTHTGARATRIMCNCRFSMTFYISINVVYFLFLFRS